MTEPKKAHVSVTCSKCGYGFLVPLDSKPPRFAKVMGSIGLFELFLVILILVKVW